MQSTMCLGLAILLATIVQSTAHGESSNPVSKVVELLSGLQAKIVADGAKEDKAFEEYVDWCKTGAQDKEWEIKTATAEIEDLTAVIGKAASDIGTLRSKLEDLASSIATADADLKAATEIREREVKEFLANEAELVDAVDTLERAINVLERKMGESALVQSTVNRKDVDALVRTLSNVINAASLSLHDKQKLVALAQSGEDEDDADDVGAPAPEAYKGHSDNIIDVLEDLKQKAEQQLDEARREETNTKHNYALLKQSLEDQMKAETKDMSEAKTMKANAEETKAAAESDLGVAQKELATSKSVLASMESDCQATARDHEVSLKTRAEELEALAAAIKAIQEMTSGAVELTYNVSFLQLRRAGAVGSVIRTRADLANFEVVNLIRKLAREQHSAALTQLAGRISAAMHNGAAAGADPFTKVKALISEMIARLVKEGGEEAEHKAYCDKEMAETKQKTGELKYDIEKLSSKIDKATSLSASLKDEVATLGRELREIAASQAEADKVRAEEHAAYVQAKADLEQGVSGIQMALKVLREYYANAATPALVQQPESPGTHAKAEGAGTTIIGMLEVVESDFTRNLADTELEEREAAVAYEKLSQENRISKSMKEKDVEYKTKEAASLDKQLLELASDRDSAQTELDAVLAYSQNIRGMCELKPESYEERVARREAEIAGLKSALEVLSGEAVLMQRGSTPLLRGLRQ